MYWGIIMKHDIKEQTGVMVMKDGLAWGQTYSDGHSTSYGCMNPCYAPIHDPKYCTKTTDVTYENSHYIEELEKGKLVKVVKTTTVKILEEL